MSALSILLGGLAAAMVAALTYQSGVPSVQVAGAVISIAGFAFVSYSSTRPRVAYAEGSLLLFLRTPLPTRLPIDVVEVFFLGQGPVAGPNDKNDGTSDVVATNVVIRLAESERQWHDRPVHLMYGVWRDGYITIRGMWCEKLTPSVLKRMNQRLVEIKRARRGKG